MIAPTLHPATGPVLAPSDPASGPLDYLSASRLKCWQECRLRFFYRYVERVPTTTSPALFVGRAVHHVLQRWNLARWRGLPSDPETLKAAVDAYWDGEQEGESIDWGKKGEADQREGAWGMLEHYLQNTPVPNDENP
ncbi:hypothetical protein BH23VER1_BH23VER1_32650 [soil metagenome]